MNTDKLVSERILQRMYGNLQKEHKEHVILGHTKGSMSHIDGSSNAPIPELHLYGQSLQDGIPSPEEPKEIKMFGVKRKDGKFDISVRTIGANLFKIPFTTNTINGVTLTNNGDGTLTLDGTASKNAQFNITVPEGSGFIPKPINGNRVVRRLFQLGGDYTGNISSNTFTTNWEGADDGKYLGNISWMQTGLNYRVFRITVESGCVCDNLKVGFMIGYEGDLDVWQPYQETIATIILDSPLCGLLVSSGGNYVDEKGQHWLTDEIILYPDGTGKMIKRCGYINLKDIPGSFSKEPGSQRYRTLNTVSNLKRYSDANVVNPLLCSHYPSITSNQTWIDQTGISTERGLIQIGDGRFTDNLGNRDEFNDFIANNDIFAVYELANPIIEPLTSDQIKELQKLTTFSPITNLSTGNAKAGFIEASYYCNTENGNLIGDLHDNMMKNRYEEPDWLSIAKDAIFPWMELETGNRSGYIYLPKLLSVIQKMYSDNTLMVGDIIEVQLPNCLLKLIPTTFFASSYGGSIAMYFQYDVISGELDNNIKFYDNSDGGFVVYGPIYTSSSNSALLEGAKFRIINANWLQEVLGGGGN